MKRERKSAKVVRCEHGAPSENDCRRLSRIVNKWKKVLRLDAHTIAVQFEERDQVNHDGEPTRMADARSGWPYHEHAVRIFPCFFEHDREGQDIAILHELIHLVFGGYDTLLHRAQEGRTPTDDAIGDVAESTTDWLTRILWVMSNGSLPSKGLPHA